MPRKLSSGEEQLAIHLRCYKIGFEREYVFAPPRKWRVDFMVGSGDNLLAIEIEGGIWVQGRHQTAKGFADDLEKYNALTLAGIPLFRFSTEMVMSGQAIDVVREYLK